MTRLRLAAIVAGKNENIMPLARLIRKIKHMNHQNSDLLALFLKEKKYFCRMHVYGAALKMRMALGADRTGPMGDFSLTDAELALDQSKNWAKRKK